MTSPFAGQPGEYMPHPGAGAPTGGGGGQVAVAVVDADQAARSRLAMQLGQGATPFASINDLASRLGSIPVVIVLGPSFAGSPELAAVEQLLAARRDVGAIMVTNELSTEMLQRALRSGVKDVLQAPIEPAQLAEAVARVASGLVMAAPVPAVPSDHRGRRRAGPGHHRLLDQGRGRQVRGGHQPGRHPGPAAPRSRWCWSTPTCSSVTSP